ncbi:NT-type C2 domain [Dillenia turbinata]|uniref:NT-type C2 domain n=1 Tax=Dillenia turbinata TaxID=194707 RepID=A0AAN8Z6M9_9MAGN
MVLGLKAKSKRSGSVRVNYLILVQEIKPWPPSQSLRSLRSVVLQWENGDKREGSTNPVVPSLGSDVGDGKIDFNESFKLPLTLVRDVSVKGGDADAFQKNLLEFNLYEPRRDKTVKGQLLGTATIDLGEYGVITESLTVSAQMNSKRSFRNTPQPVLFIKIQPIDKEHSGSARFSVPKDVLLESGESVSSLMNEEYAEEAELASCTDDDGSSHSSSTISAGFASNGSISQKNGENGSGKSFDNERGANGKYTLHLQQGPEKSNARPIVPENDHQKDISSCSSSIDLSSDLGSPVNDRASLSILSESTTMQVAEKNATLNFQSSFSSLASDGSEEEPNSNFTVKSQEDFSQEVHDKVSNGSSEIEGSAQESSAGKKSNNFLASDVASVHSNVSPADSHGGGKVNGKALPPRSDLDEPVYKKDVCNFPMVDTHGITEHENRAQKHSAADEAIHGFPVDGSRNQDLCGSELNSRGQGDTGMKANILNSDRLKHVKSVRSPLDSARSTGFLNSNQYKEETKRVGSPGDAQNGGRNFVNNARKDAKVHLLETKPDESRLQRLENRVKMFERELREAAAIELSVYSIVAEHGSSTSKVHAPARRLSRLYLHATKEASQLRRANAARSAVSGLILVAKACGNDVPRLTFWLSNTVVLRVIVSHATGDRRLPLSTGSSLESPDSERGNNIKLSSLKWKESSSRKRENKRFPHESFDNWEDPQAFISALEKIEAWIFSRIIESIWWQTLTPHMQSAAAKTVGGCTCLSSKKSCGRMPCSGDEEQVNLSLDHWKRAFKDAAERLCPVRAGGHECGCLAVLARLIMEQCVARLDVAMFNAILRESADEMPMDPVSDPISDSKVLPIPAAISSFGAGAQLKNAIGNWSRWLTDLFGIDDDGASEDETDGDDTSFKSFHLLNALSDLMMLPKDMLLSKSVRKEVCPTFGASLIKRVLNSFVPDEFCPDPVPDVVLEALDSEDSLEDEERLLTNFPCNAAPITYTPPSADSLASLIGETEQSQLRRSSSVLRKSYTSDDELDSPLNLILTDRPQDSYTPAQQSWQSNGSEGHNAIRYQLLRKIWSDSE